MANLYEKIETLCAERGINITIMCRESGAARGSLTDLKMGRISSLTTETLGKIANYFGVSVSYLLGDIKSPTSEEIGPVRRALLEEIKDYSEEEAALLLARARKIKDSR